MRFMTGRSLMGAGVAAEETCVGWAARLSVSIVQTPLLFWPLLPFLLDAHNLGVHETVARLEQLLLLTATLVVILL